MRRVEGIETQCGIQVLEWPLGQMQRKRDKGRNKDDLCSWFEKLRGAIY